MANRPIFIPTKDRIDLVKIVDIDFKFYNGFSIIQKSKSINSLHEAAYKEGYKKLLEVSTKSDNKLGWQLSAFNLMVNFEENQKISLECAFQGSKVFEKNIQYSDLYFVESIKAKKDQRLKESGNIIGFKYDGIMWENEPKTAFYDWLYIKTLYTEYPNIVNELLTYDGFTDIEFNPKKSINCQAKSCAILVSLIHCNLIDDALSSKENFIKIVYPKHKHQGILDF